MLNFGCVHVVSFLSVIRSLGATLFFNLAQVAVTLRGLDFVVTDGNHLGVPVVLGTSLILDRRRCRGGDVLGLGTIGKTLLERRSSAGVMLRVSRNQPHILQ